MIDNYPGPKKPIRVQLLDRLRKEFPELRKFLVELPVRTYAGRHQLSAGAWKWHIGNKVGGYDTMTECVKAKYLSMYYSPWGDANISVEKTDPAKMGRIDDLI